MYPKIRLITRECLVVCMQVPSEDFVQEGAYLGRAQGTPAKNRKFLGFSPLFLMNPAILFFNYFILFQYSRQEGGRPIPLAVSLVVMPIGNENLGVPRNVQCPIWTLDGQRPKFLDNFAQPSDICHFFLKTCSGTCYKKGKNKFYINLLFIDLG